MRSDEGNRKSQTKTGIPKRLRNMRNFSSLKERKLHREQHHMRSDHKGLLINFFPPHRAKNVALLLAVVSICRLIEMITSRLNASIGADDAAADTISPFAIFDIFIALQGLFIFIIFVCSPKPLWMIKSWWISSGSLDLVAVTNSELGALTKDNAS